MSAITTLCFATGMGVIAVLISGVLWGTTGFAAHYAPSGANPFAVGAGAMGLGGVLLGLFAAVAGRGIPWRPLRTQIAAGVVTIMAYPLCFYGAMHYAGIALGTAVNIGSSPLMAMAIERATGKGHSSRAKTVASTLSIVGLVLLCATSHEGGSAAPNVPLGIGLGLGAGFTYAAYTAAAHEMILRGCPSNVAMGRMFGLASFFLVPFCLIIGGPATNTARGLEVLGYLALVPMVCAYVAFGIGLRTTSAATALTLTLIEPVIAACLAVFVVGESMGVLGWVGIALVLLGVLILGRTAEEDEILHDLPA